MNIEGAKIKPEDKYYVDPQGRKVSRPSSSYSIKSTSTGVSRYRHMYGTGYKHAYYKTKDGRFYMTNSQGKKSFISKQEYDHALQDQKRVHAQDTHNYIYYYDEGNGRYFWVDEKEKRHYIAVDKFQKATAHTRHFHYTQVQADAKHYYASNDGRYFFIDDEGHKFYVDKATYDKAIAQQNKGNAQASKGRRFYHKEGNYYYVTGESGRKTNISKSEYDKAVATGTKHNVVSGGNRTYYQSSDGRYFYMNNKGEKQFISEQEYQSTMRSSPAKSRVMATSARLQSYKDQVGNTGPAHGKQFDTAYAKSFSKRGQQSPPEKFIMQNELISSQMPMEKSTNYKRDYQPWEVEGPLAPDEAVPLGYSIPFVARTTKEADYPDWGPVKTERVTSLKPPMDTHEIQFDPRTSYGSTYVQPTSGPSQPIVKWNQRNPIDGTSSIPMQTSAQKDFSPPQYKIENVTGFRDHAIPQLNVDPKHFSSNNRRDYAGDKPSQGETFNKMDPHKSTALSPPSHHTGQFKSTAAKDYKWKHTGSPTIVKAEGQLMPSKLPMETKTTKQRDFVPFEIGEPEMATHEPMPMHSIPFSARTAYDADYPHWGPYKAIPAKPDNLPYRGGEIKFDHCTTYANQYHNKPEGKPAEAVNFDKHPKDPIKHSMEGNMTSTKQSDFKKPVYNFEAEENASGDQGGNFGGFQIEKAAKGDQSGNKGIQRGKSAKGLQGRNNLEFSGPVIYKAEYANNYRGDQAPKPLETGESWYADGESRVAYEVESNGGYETETGPYVYEVRGGQMQGQKVESSRASPQARYKQVNSSAKVIERNPEGHRIGVRPQSGKDRYTVHKHATSAGALQKSKQQLHQLRSQEQKRPKSKGTNRTDYTQKLQKLKAEQKQSDEMFDAKSLINTFFSQSSRNRPSSQKQSPRDLKQSVSAPKLNKKLVQQNIKQSPKLERASTIDVKDKQIHRNGEKPHIVETTRVVSSRVQNRPNSGYQKPEPTLRNSSSARYFNTEYRQSFSREGSRR